MEEEYTYFETPIQAYKRYHSIFISIFSFFFLIVLSCVSYWYDSIEKGDHAEYTLLLICMISDYVMYLLLLFGGLFHVCCFNYKRSRQMIKAALITGGPATCCGIVLIVMGYHPKFNYINRHIFRVVGYGSLTYIYLGIIKGATYLHQKYCSNNNSTLSIPSTPSPNYDQYYKVVDMNPIMQLDEGYETDISNHSDDTQESKNSILFP